MSDIACKSSPQEQIAALRTMLGDTGEQFGARIGLSKSRVSELETGKYACSVRVAVAIEDLSAGRINAADLCEEVRLARLAVAENRHCFAPFAVDHSKTEETSR